MKYLKYKQVGQKLSLYLKSRDFDFPSPPTLKAVLADLLEDEAEIKLALETVVSSKQFKLLAKHASSGTGQLYRDTLLADLGRTFTAEIVCAIRYLLNGFLGIAESVTPVGSGEPCSEMSEISGRQLTLNPQTSLDDNVPKRGSALPRYIAFMISGTIAISAIGYLSIKFYYKDAVCLLRLSCWQKEDPSKSLTQLSRNKDMAHQDSIDSISQSNQGTLTKEPLKRESLGDIIYFEQCRMGACYAYKIEGLRKLSEFSGSYYRSSFTSKCGDSMGVPDGCVVGASESHGTRVVDCLNSTINGETVPATARYGYEEGFPEEFKAVCSAIDSL